MTQIIRRKTPTVIMRLFDSFRANDAISFGETFEPHGLLVAHMDFKLLRQIGLAEPEKPVRLRGNLGISRFLEQEFAAMQVMHVEVHSEVRVGHGLSAICDYEARFLATGQTITARCSGLYTLSQNGRKVETCRTICSIITPGWTYAIN